jgi:hypothetical protein
LVLPVRSQDQPATAPSAADLQALSREYQQETAPLGGQRSFDQGVLTITLPRADLWVQADMGEIPTAAGLASQFYFYRCTCGKDKVVGQFVVADYEVNDVIDALRAGHMEVVSVAGMFVGDKPRMMSLRFQGEGLATDLTQTLKAALSWVGDARSARQSIAPSPGRSNP